MEDWRILVFQHIFEGGFMFFAALGLMGIGVDLKRLCVLSGLLGVFIWLIRGLVNLLGLFFGIHTAVIVLAAVLLGIFVLRLRPLVSVVVSLLGLILVLGSEVILFEFWIGKLDWDLANVSTRIMSGWLTNTMLLVVGIGGIYVRKRFVKPI